MKAFIEHFYPDRTFSNGFVMQPVSLRSGNHVFARASDKLLIPQIMSGNHFSSFEMPVNDNFRLCFGGNLPYRVNVHDLQNIAPVAFNRRKADVVARFKLLVPREAKVLLLRSCGLTIPEINTLLMAETGSHNINSRNAESKAIKKLESSSIDDAVKLASQYPDLLIAQLDYEDWLRLHSVGYQNSHRNFLNVLNSALDENAIKTHADALQSGDITRFENLKGHPDKADILLFMAMAMSMQQIEHRKDINRGALNKQIIELKKLLGFSADTDPNSHQVIILAFQNPTSLVGNLSPETFFKVNSKPPESMPDRFLKAMQGLIEEQKARDDVDNVFAELEPSVAKTVLGLCQQLSSVEVADRFDLSRITVNGYAAKAREVFGFSKPTDPNYLKTLIFSDLYPEELVKRLTDEDLFLVAKQSIVELQPKFADAVNSEYEFRLKEKRKEINHVLQNYYHKERNKASGIEHFLENISQEDCESFFSKLTPGEAECLVWFSCGLSKAQVLKITAKSSDAYGFFTKSVKSKFSNIDFNLILELVKQCPLLLFNQLNHKTTVELYQKPPENLPESIYRQLNIEMTQDNKPDLATARLFNELNSNEAHTILLHTEGLMIDDCAKLLGKSHITVNQYAASARKKLGYEKTDPNYQKTVMMAYRYPKLLVTRLGNKDLIKLFNEHPEKLDNRFHAAIAAECLTRIINGKLEPEFIESPALLVERLSIEVLLRLNTEPPNSLEKQFQEAVVTECLNRIIDGRLKSDAIENPVLLMSRCSTDDLLRLNKDHAAQLDGRFQDIVRDLLLKRRMRVRPWTQNEISTAREVLNDSQKAEKYNLAPIKRVRLDFLRHLQPMQALILLGISARIFPEKLKALLTTPTGAPIITNEVNFLRNRGGIQNDEQMMEFLISHADVIVDRLDPALAHRWLPFFILPSSQLNPTFFVALWDSGKLREVFSQPELKPVLEYCKTGLMQEPIARPADDVRENLTRLVKPRGQELTLAQLKSSMKRLDIESVGAA